jgi:hypothetical protein
MPMMPTGSTISEMYTAVCAVLVATLPLCDGVAPQGRDVVVAPQITVSEPRPVADAEDIFNVSMRAALTPGLVVTVRVAPTGIELQGARMMLVPKSPRKDPTTGDRIIIRALGNESIVSEVIVHDPAVALVEGPGGAARREDRTVSVALPMPTLVDTLEVGALAASTDVTARESKIFDVSRIVNEYCAQAEDTAACRQRVPN